MKSLLKKYPLQLLSLFKARKEGSKYGTSQGNLLRGIVNLSGLAQSAVQGPKQSLSQQFQKQFFFISNWNKNRFYKQCWLSSYGFHSENDFWFFFFEPAILNHFVML